MSRSQADPSREAPPDSNRVRAHGSDRRGSAGAGAAIGRCLTAAAAALAGWLLVEAAVRLALPGIPTGDTGIQPHPVWHHWHRTDHEFVYHVAAEGYQQRVRFNAHGQRDSRPLTPEKPPGVRRVAVLGDSFAEALQVEEEAGICRQLEVRLSQAAPTQVLNFGCSGFSSCLEYLLLREWALAWDPDLVICLHHFSDICEDWRFRQRAVFSGEELVAVPAAGEGWSRRIRRGLEWSYVWRLAARAWQRHAARSSAGASLQDSYDAIVNDPYTAADRLALAYSLGYLERMDRLLRQRGIGFVVVLVPLGPQVEPVPAEFARQLGLRYLAGGQRLEHQGYQREVAAWCSERGIAWLDLLPGFREANPNGQPWLFLPRDQHWTAAGHALAARLVARNLPAFPLRRAEEKRSNPAGPDQGLSAPLALGAASAGWGSPTLGASGAWGRGAVGSCSHCGRGWTGTGRRSAGGGTNGLYDCP
jgi:hypothetical protein